MYMCVGLNPAFERTGIFLCTAKTCLSVQRVIDRILPCKTLSCLCFLSLIQQIAAHRFLLRSVQSRQTQSMQPTERFGNAALKFFFFFFFSKGSFWHDAAFQCGITAQHYLQMILCRVVSRVETAPRDAYKKQEFEKSSQKCVFS